MFPWRREGRNPAIYLYLFVYFSDHALKTRYKERESSSNAAQKKSYSPFFVGINSDLSQMSNPEQCIKKQSEIKKRTNKKWKKVLKEQIKSFSATSNDFFDSKFVNYFYHIHFLNLTKPNLTDALTLCHCLSEWGLSGSVTTVNLKSYM